jgi:hypothetical protein
MILFTVLSYPDTQRPLKPWFKRVQILLELVADLGHPCVVHVMRVLQTVSWSLPGRFQSKAWEAR